MNCNAGYEFWFAEQSELRNSYMKLHGLAWLRQVGSMMANSGRSKRQE
jgi:hypothetical protein